MKGNTEIAEILKDRYGIDDLTPYEEIEYEIENYSDEVSRVKIQSKSGINFCCPVYAMFDGYHMSWYGDYGFWGFSCTWKTNVMNLAYGSPYYQLEKLESREREEFDEEQCQNELLKHIKEGMWYTYDLSEEQKTRFNEFMKEPFDFICSDDCLYEYEEECEKLKELQNAAENEHMWHAALCNLKEDDFSLFDCEDYELHDIGMKAPCRFFIILYMLSVVANQEKEGGGSCSK